MSALFEIKGLSSGYGKIPVLHGIDLSLNDREVLGILGNNGMGKSTLLKTLMGVISVSSGSIVYSGQDLTKMKPGQRAQHGIGYVPQGRGIFPNLTVLDNLRMGIVGHGLDEEDAIRNIVLDFPRLESLLERSGGTLSGGEQQILALARCLVSEPDLILLDEPTSALDVSVQAQVLNLLDSIQKERGLTFIFITHSLNVVNHISDRVAVMYLGKIVEIAETDELFANPAHPYTHALLSAIPQPSVEENQKQRIVLSGDVPSPANPPSGCSFHTRCPIAVEGKCDVDEPELEAIIGGHKVACHFPVEAGGSLPMLND